MTPAELLRLAERVESLTGPNFAIEVEIAKAVRTYLGKHGYADEEVPLATASLDDAMSLVPKGMEVELTDLYGVARVTVGLNTNGGGAHGEHKGGNLVLALTAAALRAGDDHEESEIGSLREKLSDALAGGLPHKSDCAASRAPAYEPSACDCGVGTLAEKFESLLRGVVRQFRKTGCECTFPSDSCCDYSAAKTFLDGRAGDDHEGDGTSLTPVGYIYQPHGADQDKWDYSHGVRPDLSQGAYWSVKPVYTAGRTTTSFKCAARRQGGAGGNYPADCDWPECGCDADRPLEPFEVRAGINILLETIAKKFEGRDTLDIWKSDAAAIVRSYKHASDGKCALCGGDVYTQAEMDEADKEAAELYSALFASDGKESEGGVE